MTDKEINDEVISSIDALYQDIDKCIMQLIKARLEHDSDTEGQTLYWMESLMVSTQQELSFLHGYLEK